ncbi:MAG: hypothetical protein J1F41_10255 [Lachnospiraceae bacterium]|nr:hypothetical protein [Lachnospiraceae bacterium]
MENKKKRTPKQIAALICVIILVCLYLVTFLVAFLDFPGWDRLFAVCLLATVGLPILLWIYIWLYGKTTNKHTIASADFLGGDSDAEATQESDKE